MFSSESTTTAFPNSSLLKLLLKIWLLLFLSVSESLYILEEIRGVVLLGLTSDPKGSGYVMEGLQVWVVLVLLLFMRPSVVQNILKLHAPPALDI